MLAQGSLPAIEVWFYVLSIAVIIVGLAGAAFKAATAWGRGRATWDEQLELTKQIRTDQAAHLQHDDDRFAANDTRFATLEQRLRALEMAR